MTQYNMDTRVALVERQASQNETDIRNLRIQYTADVKSINETMVVMGKNITTLMYETKSNTKLRAELWKIGSGVAISLLTGIVAYLFAFK